MNKIILIGFRCTGKTTIGKELAKKLNWNFIDLDEKIQKREGKSIKEIVKEKGWDYFREIEKKEMKNFKNLKNVIIALGGGSVIHQEEMKNLSDKSLVVWLYSSPEIILKRIKEDKKTDFQRPPLKNTNLEEEIETVLKERNPLYEKFSQLKIDTDKKSIKEITEIIIKEFLRIKGVNYEN